MKKLYLIVCLILLINLNIFSALKNDENINILKIIFSSKKVKYSKIFDISFLNTVPEEKIAEVINQYRNKLGELKNVLVDPGQGYILIFEKGKAPAKIVLNKDKLITGFWLGNLIYFEDNLDKIIQEFDDLGGSYSISIIVNNSSEVVRVNENLPLAVGSSFKLVVLKALMKKIETGKASWDSVIKLNENYKSLPSGILQNWPNGTPLTLKSLANLMISISDNTATDLLLNYLGKKNIEKYAPRRTWPFLSTLEFFKLKWGVKKEIQEKFIKGSLKRKRVILKEIASSDKKLIAFNNNPTAVGSIGWLFTTKELNNLIYELRKCDVLGINSGLVNNKNWILAAFKGGSEPGVLQYTHLLKKNDNSDIYAISVTVNNENETLNEQKINELTVRLISLIENGKLKKK